MAGGVLTVSHRNSCVFDGEGWGLTSQPLSGLENAYTNLVCSPIDVSHADRFDDFLYPNEGTPSGSKVHLDQMEPGLIVSTGTERSFFDLILSDESRCSGLIVRDINPKVKAYVDFNVLLLRLANTREEYGLLALEPADFGERIANIRKLIIESDHIPPVMKDYYNGHLEQFAKIYYGVTKEGWAIEGRHSGCDFRWKLFNGVNYFQDDEMFAKLHRYARAGKIIATTGTINDLTFIQETISIVDISNIHDYTFIDLRGGPIFHPRVVWTDIISAKTKYCSYIHREGIGLKRQEFENLMQKISESEKIAEPQNLLLSMKNRFSVALSDGEQIPGSVYSLEVFQEVQKYCEENLCPIPKLGYVNMSTQISRLNELSPEELRVAAQSSSIYRFAHPIVQAGLPDATCYYVRLKPSAWISFIDIPGWKEVFEQVLDHATSKQIQLLFRALKAQGLLQRIVSSFGEKRVAGWISLFGKR